MTRPPVRRRVGRFALMAFRPKIPSNSLLPYALKILRFGEGNGMKTIKPTLSYPSDQEVRIALWALAGKSMEDIMALEPTNLSDIQAAIKRVRDSMRRGEPPLIVKERFPELCKWQRETYGESFTWNEKTEPEPMPRAVVRPTPKPKPAPAKAEPPRQIEELVEEAGVRREEKRYEMAALVPLDEAAKRIEALGDVKFKRLKDEEEEDGIRRFVSQCKSMATLAILPVLYRAIGRGVMANDEPSKRMAVEVLGVGAKRVPQVAQQFNFGSGPRARSAQHMEARLRSVKAAETEGSVIEASTTGDDGEDE